MGPAIAKGTAARSSLAKLVKELPKPEGKLRSLLLLLVGIRLLMPILCETLKCRVALVLTSSAGSNRMPTAHRMIISEDEVSKEGLEILQGQLF